MFHYLSLSEIQELVNSNINDVFVSIDHNAKGERGLIDTIANALNSPYKDDNWDGITEVLIDPFWLNDQVVRIIHYELPDLSDDEMRVYLSILKYISDEWSKKEDFRPGAHCPDLIIYFRSDLKNEIDQY